MDAVTSRRRSVQELVDLVFCRLSDPLGLEQLQVWGSGSPRAQVVASAGDDPAASAETLVLPLDVRGRSHGAVFVAGNDLRALEPDTASAVVHHLADAREAEDEARNREHERHAALAVLRLFREGASARSVDAAGRVLAQVALEVFSAERAAVLLVDTEGRISDVVGVGLPDRLADDLRAGLVRRRADDSPVWRSAALGHGPILVGDARDLPVRVGGAVETMRLRTYVLIPLMSSAGLLGATLCGDSSRTRGWSEQDHDLAARLALEGALVVETARLRQLQELHLAELTHRAFHDGLTGLPNRSRLMDRVGDAVRTAAATGARVTLLLVDLDGFKRVNDELGHVTGDRLLELAATRMRDVVRPGDLVARLGGDEFAVLLEEHSSVPAGAAVARRVHAALTAPYDVDGHAVRVGASVGVGRIPDSGLDEAALLRAADDAMYRCKRGGGRAVVA